MRRATKSLLIASLLGAACSAEDPNIDPTIPPGSGTGTDTSGGGTLAPTSGSPTGGTSGSTSPTNPTSGQTGGSVAPNPTNSGDTGTEEPPPPTGTCVPGIPQTSQVPRMSPIQYDNALRDLLNVTDVGGKTPSGALGTGENKGAMTSTEWVAYQNVAASIAASVMAGDKSAFMACEPEAEGCLETTVREFGLKAFRRPLTDEEVATFMGFNTLTPAGTPAEVAEAILYGFLTSPSFIMLPELAEEKDGEAYKLDQYEIGARLATLIWRSVPDATLLDAAKNNQLGTAAEVKAQAERMIAVKEKSGPLFADYHRFYAEINSSSHWGRTEHNPDYFPANTTKEAFTASMMTEVDLFFGEVANEGTFRDLFLSPVAYINQDNAEIYGENPADYTAEFVRVELDAAERPGFLTRTAFLSSFSGFTKTSPILRGAYIGQKMLGSPPVAAQPNVPTEPPPGVEYKTRREEVEALTEPSGCKACHATAINPPGFVMEMYDSMGKVQTVDPLGGPINMVADVQVDGVVKPINNPLELMQAIANGVAGQKRYAEKWVEYATGRSPNGNDYCAVEPIAMKLNTDGTYTIVQLLADLTQSETFLKRTTGN